MQCQGVSASVTECQTSLGLRRRSVKECQPVSASVYVKVSIRVSGGSLTD